MGVGGGGRRVSFQTMKHLNNLKKKEGKVNLSDSTIYHLLSL